jgi:hypothetical protein
MLQSLQNALSTGVLPKDPLDARNLGVDVPKEILAHLDSTLVLYRSLSEGPFLLGQGIAIKVKDASKLGEGMHKLAKGLAKAAGGLEMQKRTYRGVDMFVWPPSGFPAAPTYAIHQGWLVIGVFPQPVKGFILRAEGKHKVWQPPALVAEALTLAKKKTPPHGKLAAVTVTDPRPSVAVGLSLMPVAVRSWASSFDISKIPNAQAVTDWQLSGVTLFYDDGNALRWESHSSIEAPEEWMLFMFVPQVFR